MPNELPNMLRGRGGMQNQPPQNCIQTQTEDINILVFHGSLVRAGPPAFNSFAGFGQYGSNSTLAGPYNPYVVNV